ncbi:Ampk-like protein Snf1, partial [Conidiobolus coronatus NRRL 28638]
MLSAVTVSLDEPKPTVFRTPLGEFKVLKTIGEGSYGKVKLVTNLVNNEKVDSMVREAAGRKRRVTLKIRIQREANLAKLLDHPNLVKLRDFRTSTSHFYLFFDYVQGVQLAECIPSHGMSESRATKYLAQLVDALAYCHRHSVVHRDIKIENIMVDSHDRIKLIDFGLANFYDPSSHLNTSCGTIPYTAPEILRGDKYIGPEIDIWSLGVVLFTMLTGSLPFGDPRIHNNYWTIMNSQVNYPPTMSKLAHDCITKCLI